MHSTARCEKSFCLWDEKMHLLAVDDEPAILQLIELLVQFNGEHTVTAAECAVDALDVLAQPDAEPIDCFLVDIQMPGTDGIELCKILRSRHDHKKTPVLMLTAMSDKSYIDRAFSAGATDYITKPIDIDDLLGRIKLIEEIVFSRKKQNQQPDLSNTGATETDAPLALHEPFHVRDINGMIDYLALENYISLMARKKLFGSAVFAFSIRDIEGLFRQTSRFEYECLVADVAEAITLGLSEHPHLISYAGNGTFVCIVEDGWQPDSEALADKVNIAIHTLGLYFNDGRPMSVKVSAGDVIRLVWKSGDSAIDALSAAHQSAEKESRRYAKDLENFWDDKDIVSR
jgi:CheY-like chemotaxis protein